MDFNSLNSFYIVYENEEQELTIFLIERFTWKVTQIEFPEDLIESIK